MNKFNPRGATSCEESGTRSGWVWFRIAGCLLVILSAILWLRPGDKPPVGPTPADIPGSGTSSNSRNDGGVRRLPRGSRAGSALAAEEIVANKVSQFGQSRRKIARAMGQRTNTELPSEIEEFFDAVETGRWEEIDARFNAMAKRSGQFEGSTHSPDLDPFWPAVLDAYGAAEQAHDWPAQKLLDYGNGILDSLRPGMVYVGGTDNGRWIPELLNETSDGERHVIVTQNAFADARYLDYLSVLYGDRLAALTTEDSQHAFQEYMTEAQKRFQHDQQFPDEPKQIRPGEEITSSGDGRIQVSGQVAVMDINQRLLKDLMAKNPELSFALQESFPLRGTYADAVPLGPIMELRAPDWQDTFTPERAAQSLDYWRTTAQQLLADATASGSSATMKSYSHDATAAANLLAAHNFNAEAEQAFRLSSQLWPGNPDPVANLAEILARTGRPEEAQQLVNDFLQKNPDERSTVEKVRASVSFSNTSPSPNQGPRP